MPPDVATGKVVVAETAGAELGEDRTMPRDLIVGYDDSDGARAALQAAIDLASEPRLGAHKLLHLADRPVLAVPAA